jgi:mono/diheme cytochrome c family protein
MTVGRASAVALWGVELAAVLAAVLVALAACGGDRASTILGLEGDKKDGAEVFAANCESCHGADGKSGTAKENVPGEDEGEIVDAVLNGKEDGAMPSFGDDLTDQEIADLLAFIKTL